LTVAARHDVFGWQLLAEAMAGRLDLEALTQLHAGEQAAIPLRSLWILAEAERALPDHPAELAQLVRSARDQSRQAAADALAALEQKPNDAQAFGRAMYAALANRGDKDFVAKARPLLARPQGANSPLAPAAFLAAAVLAQPSDIDKSALVELIQKRVTGDDLVVLAALACGRAGEETWSAFRAESAHLLGNQPLSGHVVVLVNRLGGTSVQ
jgi:hypothetical protein